MRALSVVVFASLALPATAQTSAQIRAVTLSTAGLALIEAEASLGADGLRLPIRRADINDFLKSLRLSDPAGGVPRLTFSGPGMVQDTFAALPFGPEALSDLHTLLAAMVGAPVRAVRHGNMLEGALMGTTGLPCPPDMGEACAALTLRMADGTLRQIALDGATELGFLDEGDSAAIAQGLDALRMGARAQVVDVTLNSTQAGPRRVGLGWLQPAPLWKTAWRAEDGPEGVILTGWAVIENTTGQDWQDISLTLATGAVQALEVQLYERLEAARKLAAPQLEPAFAASQPMAREMAFEADMAIAPVGMEDTDSFSRFTLSQPVSLRAGEMISLPFLSEALEEARLTLYTGGSGSLHPMIAIEFENPLPLRLPAGVVTLYEQGRGHAGDAMIPEMAPGAREVIEFAQDTAMRISERTQDSVQVRAGRIVNGVLLIEESLERRTAYRIEGAPVQDRVLTLLHPLHPGWQVQTEGGVAGFAETRFSVAVPAGENVTHEVLETQLVTTEIALLPLEGEALAFWSGRVPDAGLRATLDALQALRHEEQRLSAELAQTQAQEAELVADQARLAGLVTQLGTDSAATATRRARIDAIDDEITDARAARATAQARLTEIRQEIEALIGGS
jgi:hypothetical protein